MTLEERNETIRHYILQNTISTSLTRGKRYFKKGAVKTVLKEDTYWLFIIEGSLFYSVEVTFDLEQQPFSPTLQCNCAYSGEGLCKHKVAALLWVIENSSESATHNGKTLPTSPAKTAKKKKPVRYANMPLEIMNFTRLTTNELNQRYSGQYSVRYDDIDFGPIRQLPEYEYEIDATFSGFYQNKPETQIIRMAINENNMLVTCNCGRRAKKLCVHAYTLMTAMIHNGLLAALKPLSPDELEKRGQEEIEKYGLDPSRPWKDYFSLQFADGGQQFELKEKYQHLTSPDDMDSETIPSLFQYRPEVRLEYHNNIIDRNPYTMGFAFYFDERNSAIKLFPVVAKKGKKQQPMEVGFKSYDRLSRYEEVYPTQGKGSLIHLGNQLAQMSYYGEENLSAILHLLTTELETLANYPHLYINNSRYQILKSTLEPISFNAAPPDIVLVIEEQQNTVSFSLTLTNGAKSTSLTTGNTQWLHEFFLKIEDTLYFIPSLHRSAQFGLITSLIGRHVMLKKFPEFFEKVLAEPAKRFEIEFKNPKTMSVTTQQKKALQKELYISELNNFIIFRPFLRYEDDSLHEVMTEINAWQQTDTGLVKTSFDKEMGAAFISEIKEAHEEFKKQGRSDFFYLTIEALKQSDTFLPVFSHFREKNIKVLGLKDLKSLKVNPYPGKVSYSVKSNTDWFEVEVEVAFGDEKITIGELKKRFVPGNKFIELSDGKQGIIPEEWLEKLEKIINSGEVREGKIEIPNKKFNLIDTLFDQLEDEQTLSFIHEKRSKLLHFNGIADHPLPAMVKADLRHYQEEGFRWLCCLHDLQWGGILADDMGLGKTLQVITFLAHIIEKSEQASLVVVPTSLLYNWENEIEKFAPTIKTYFYHGTGRDRTTTYFDDYDIILTSYGTVLSDIALLREYRFHYVILDESQAIKNAASKRYKAVRLLKATNRIAMTGTPIENNTFDLYAQMSFVNPGFLGAAAAFKKGYATPIDVQRDGEKARELQQMIKPFVLRRTKEQVARELPDKIENILYCEMPAAQRKVYDAFRNEYRNVVLQKIEEDGLAKARFSILEGLTKLRQVCDSPEILPGNDAYTDQSAKLDELILHIREKTANHKILVFSQFVKMLKVIAGHIAKENIDYEYLDGKSTPADRVKSVDRFQSEEDCRVFLISLKAGGTGLNLMAADYVYLVDPWWNPAVENQAIDRCYRIGQDKKVIAYRMICKDTIEEKIVELQQTKKAIAGDIISTDENILGKMNKEEVLDLFGMN